MRVTAPAEAPASQVALHTALSVRALSMVPEGDEFLVGFAKRLRAQIRPGDNSRGRRQHFRRH